SDPNQPQSEPFQTFPCSRLDFSSAARTGPSLQRPEHTPRASRFLSHRFQYRSHEPFLRSLPPDTDTALSSETQMSPSHLPETRSPKPLRCPHRFRREYPLPPSRPLPDSSSRS